MHILNEHYHIYNYGAHNEKLFRNKYDYEHFLALIFTHTRRGLVDNVEIIAYCLMAGHFHLVLREKTPCGISRSIHRLCTAYAMYFNSKYNRSGPLFQGQYRSKHVEDDDNLRYLIQYVHLMPYGVRGPEQLMTAKQSFLYRAIERSRKYRYSSFKGYLCENRPQKRYPE